MLSRIKVLWIRWGNLWRDWRLVYAPCMGKTRFYDPDEWAIRHSDHLDKRTALKYLEVFDDAVCIEKVRGFRKGREIYKKWAL